MLAVTAVQAGDLPRRLGACHVTRVAATVSHADTAPAECHVADMADEWATLCTLARPSICSDRHTFRVF